MGGRQRSEHRVFAVRSVPTHVPGNHLRVVLVYSARTRKSYVRASRLSVNVQSENLIPDRSHRLPVSPQHLPRYRRNSTPGTPYLLAYLRARNQRRIKGILGSSLSSGAARRRQRIRHEAPEDGVGDAPFEAPQRLLARFALSDLLAVVGPTPSVRPSLAYRDHVQGVVELAVACQREPV